MQASFFYISLIVFNSDLSIIDETMDIDDGIVSNGVVKNFVMVVTSINPNESKLSLINELCGVLLSNWYGKCKLSAIL